MKNALTLTMMGRALLKAVASVVAVIALPTGAMAHIGHMGELAGHDHTVAGIAIGAAIAVGVAQVLKGRKTRDAEPAAEETAEIDEDAEEASA